MIGRAILKIIIVAISVLVVVPGYAGTDPKPTVKKAEASSAIKPYKILTSGKRITIQSKTDIARVMVWTPKGHRFIEENNINAASYSFNVTIRENFFYLMLEMRNGKRFTEKIGINNL